MKKIISLTITFNLLLSVCGQNFVYAQSVNPADIKNQILNSQNNNSNGRNIHMQDTKNPSAEIPDAAVYADKNPMKYEYTPGFEPVDLYATEPLPVKKSVAKELAKKAFQTINGKEGKEANLEAAIDRVLKSEDMKSLIEMSFGDPGLMTDLLTQIFFPQERGRLPLGAGSKLQLAALYRLEELSEISPIPDAKLREIFQKGSPASQEFVITQAYKRVYNFLDRNPIEPDPHPAKARIDQIAAAMLEEGVDPEYIEHYKMERYAEYDIDYTAPRDPMKEYQSEKKSEARVKYYIGKNKKENESRWPYSESGPDKFSVSRADAVPPVYGNGEETAVMTPSSAPEMANRKGYYPADAPDFLLNPASPEPFRGTLYGKTLSTDYSQISMEQVLDWHELFFNHIVKNSHKIDSPESANVMLQSIALFFMLDGNLQARGIADKVNAIKSEEFKKVLKQGNPKDPSGQILNVYFELMNYLEASYPGTLLDLIEYYENNLEGFRGFDSDAEKAIMYVSSPHEVRNTHLRHNYYMHEAAALQIMTQNLNVYSYAVQLYQKTNPKDFASKADYDTYAGNVEFAAEVALSYYSALLNYIEDPKYSRVLRLLATGALAAVDFEVLQALVDEDTAKTIATTFEKGQYSGLMPTTGLGEKISIEEARDMVVMQKKGYTDQVVAFGQYNDVKEGLLKHFERAYADLHNATNYRAVNSTGPDVQDFKDSIALGYYRFGGTGTISDGKGGPIYVQKVNDPGMSWHFQQAGAFLTHCLLVDVMWTGGLGLLREANVVYKNVRHLAKAAEVGVHGKMIGSGGRTVFGHIQNKYGLYKNAYREYSYLNKTMYQPLRRQMIMQNIERVTAAGDDITSAFLTKNMDLIGTNIRGMQRRVPFTEFMKHANVKGSAEIIVTQGGRKIETAAFKEIKNFLNDIASKGAFTPEAATAHSRYITGLNAQKLYKKLLAQGKGSTAEALEAKKVYDLSLRNGYLSQLAKEQSELYLSGVNISKKYNALIKSGKHMEKGSVEGLMEARAGHINFEESTNLLEFTGRELMQRQGQLIFDGAREASQRAVGLAVMFGGMMGGMQAIGGAYYERLQEWDQKYLGGLQDLNAEAALISAYLDEVSYDYSKYSDYKTLTAEELRAEMLKKTAAANISSPKARPNFTGFKAPEEYKKSVEEARKKQALKNIPTAVILPDNTSRKIDLRMDKSLVPLESVRRPVSARPVLSPEAAYSADSLKREDEAAAKRKADFIKAHSTPKLYTPGQEAAQKQTNIWEYMDVEAARDFFYDFEDDELDIYYQTPVHQDYEDYE